MLTECPNSQVKMHSFLCEEKSITVPVSGVIFVAFTVGTIINKYSRPRNIVMEINKDNQTQSHQEY